MSCPKVLIVDDQADIRDFLSRLVEKKVFCKVDTAADAAEAMQKVHSQNYEVVLLDIKMPGLNGVDFLKQAADIAPKTKFAVISGYDSHEVASKALEAGAVDFISKTENPETIILKLKVILNSQ
jgi:YesN/AraC family two-component response regulator